MATTWTDNNDILQTQSNDGGLTIDKEGIITIDELQEDDYEFEISLDDLIDNPYRPLVAVDPVSKKIPMELMPPIVIGKVVTKNTLLEMLSLNYGDTPTGGNDEDYLNRGQICRVLEVRSSFMLVGTNPNLLNNWSELVAKFTSWENIQNKPDEFPPEDHDHDDIYARLIGGKIPAKYLRSIQLGDRFTADSLGEMLNLQAESGDVCSRSDESKLYLLCGVNGLLPDGRSHNWVYIPSPLAAVQSINGENGVVFLDHNDVGAAAEIHEHEIFELVDNIDSSRKYSLRKNTQDKISIYENDEFLYDLADLIHEHNEYSKVDHEHNEYSKVDHEHNEINSIENHGIKFHFNGTNLYYSINGGAFLPFA